MEGGGGGGYPAALLLLLLLLGGGIMRPHLQSHVEPRISYPTRFCRLSSILTDDAVPITVFLSDSNKPEGLEKSFENEGRVGADGGGTHSELASN